MTHYPVGTYKYKRDSKGKFSSFLSGTKKWCKRLFLVGLLGGITFIAGAVFTPRTIATPVLQDNLTPKIEELKQNLVEDIRNCERSSYTEDDAPIILDTNKKMSIGTFMYQKATVQYYYSTLYGKKITGKEATLIALDEEQARKLTYDIIFKDSKGWRNWFNCGTKVGAEAQLKIIKELQK